MIPFGTDAIFQVAACVMSYGWTDPRAVDARNPIQPHDFPTLEKNLEARRLEKQPEQRWLTVWKR